MKIRTMGAQSSRTVGRSDGRTDGRTDGQTDMTKLTVTFHNFAKVPKNRAFQQCRITPKEPF
jgi:hypothetical protein